MNFDLSEDEALLKALAERFVTDRYDIERRRSYLAQPAGFSPENWELLGKLGVLAALLERDPEQGGLTATSIASIFEALGRGMAVEPLIENILVAGRLFAATASPDLREEWLPDLASGVRRIAFAHGEEKARPGRVWVETRAETAGDGLCRLSGDKLHVPAGVGVNGYIVSARHSGAPNDLSGIGLYLVPADAAGLMRTGWRMADGSAAVSLQLREVTLPSGHRLDGDGDAIEAVQTAANLARAAEAIGIMEKIFADTLEYLRARVQFGVALATFQALQHRMAMQYGVIEQSRGLLNLALVSANGSNFARAVQGARAFISSASIDLGHDMMQFHGGMGVTDELPIGHGHKRMLVLSRWPDDPETALDRFARIAV